MSERTAFQHDSHLGLSIFDDRVSIMRRAPHRPMTAVQFHILLTLSRGIRHGYAVKREVEERTGGAVRLGAGTLYAAVKRLVDETLIREAPPPASGAEDASSRWRFYAITDSGQSALEAELKRLEQDVKVGRALLREGRSKAMH